MGWCGVVPVLVLLVYPAAAYLPHNDCDEPPPIANSYRTFPDNNTVQYRCMDTYFLSAGNLIRYCLNGTYNGTSPVCTLDCGPPLNTSYASINSTGTIEGDKVTYTCPDGFLLSSTDTECSATSGYWLAGDRCFANVSLDVTQLTATQTSTATWDDIVNASLVVSSLPRTSTFDASNAVDQTKLGLSLLAGACSSTKLQQRPSMNVNLGRYYTIHQVAVTLPNDDFAYSLPNLIVWSYHTHFNSRSTCTNHKDTIPVGSRFVAVCSHKRYSVAGKYLRLQVDFGKNPGMLQICHIEVYAHPLTSVDCGQPPPVPFAVITTPPLSTFYNFGATTVTYECIEGYTMKSGKGTAHCHFRGEWIVSITCTDDENLSLRKPVYLLNNDTTDLSQLTDGNTSSCALNLNVSEATFVIDLGTDTEVRDVTFYDVEYLKDSYVDVSVRRDGFPESFCERNSVSDDGRKTINTVCVYGPVGRYVIVHYHINPIQICEVMVHGRPYTEVFECYNGQASYKGHTNVTTAGIPCQRWDSQSPHAHSYTDISKFPDDNFADAANYCRNPDGRYGLWCFTVDPDVTWQFCPIRNCHHLCLLDDKGLEYKGYEGQTSSGDSCVKWNGADIPFKRNNFFPSSKNVADCRNPTLSQSRPWCYTSNDAGRYGLCDIPSCPTTENMMRGHWTLDAYETLDDILPSTLCLVWNKFYTSDTYSSTTEKSFKPTGYKDSSMVPEACHAGKVFNTTFLCFNRTQSGTVWKAGVLECVHCGTPPSISNATVSVSSSLQNGIATYACVKGYGHASGSNLATCLKTGKWEVADMECRVDCDAPPSINHADVNVSSTLLGQTAVYSCRDGFKQRSGSHLTTCLDTGEWEVNDLKCVVNCGDPPSASGTEVSPTDGFLNETVEYTCKPGYAHVSGSAVISCLDTGTWEDPRIYCEVDCGTPPSLDHADVDVNSTLLGQTANYSCQEGYAHLCGSTEVICLDTGKWNVSVLKCEVNCGNPPSLNRTEVSPTDGFVNETAKYTCKPGYAHVSGSAVISCLDTGTWEDPRIYCEVNCGNPPSLNGTEVSPTDGFVSETAKYTCKPGYAHVMGSAVITCLDTGTWEDPKIYCEVDCRSPPVVANTVVITDNTTLNSTAVYRCSPGFVRVNGSTNITCLGTGFWETPLIRCAGISSPLTMASPTAPDVPVNKFGRTVYEKCTCRCINKQILDQEDIVNKITKELILDTKSLKSYTMTKKSLPDGRKSSKGVAYIAISVIGVPFGVVFLSDIYYLITVITGCFAARQ